MNINIWFHVQLERALVPPLLPSSDGSDAMLHVCVLRPRKIVSRESLTTATDDFSALLSHFVTSEVIFQPVSSSAYYYAVLSWNLNVNQTRFLGSNMFISKDSCIYRGLKKTATQKFFIGFSIEIKL